jgi:hypothetical protein
MKKRMLLIIIFVVAISASAKVLTVPLDCPTLQKAVFAARCNDTIFFDSVPDNAQITVANKVLHFIGMPKHAPLAVINAPIAANYSKCFFKRVKITGSQGPVNTVGYSAILAIRSQIEIDSCILQGGVGGGNTSCGSRIQGGFGLKSSLSATRIINSTCLQGPWGGIPGNCICLSNCPQYPLFGISLIDSSKMEKSALIVDSILVDSTSYISSGPLVMNYDCIVFGSDTAQFSIVPGVKLMGTPYGTVRCFDYNNDNNMDIVISAYYSRSIYEQTNINMGDWNFSDKQGGGISIWNAGSNADVGDVDNDGDLDYMTGTCISTNGTLSGSGAQWNTPLGFLAYSVFGDYNNDGRLDIIQLGDSSQNGFAFYTILWKNTPTGFVRTPIQLIQMDEGSAAWGDYDKDGDLDLLITGGINTCTKIYRNDGDSFTCINDSLPGNRLGRCFWADIDNDGNLEAIASGYIFHITNNIVTWSPKKLPGFSSLGDMDNDGKLDLVTFGSYFRIEPDTFVNVPFIAAGVGISQGMGSDIGDFDNDGDLDAVVMGAFGSAPDQGTNVIMNNCKVKNYPPTAPSNLRTTVNGGIVTFSWNAAQDDHTPSHSLSYSLRVGKTPGGCEIMSPESDPKTGYHRVPRMGNVDLDTLWKLKNLTAGTYYWSVQAIDNSWVGSPFATEQSFSVGPTKICGNRTGNYAQFKINNRIIYLNGVDASEKLSLRVFDMKGRLVFACDKKTSGNSSIRLKDEIGNGIYIYKLYVEDENDRIRISRSGKINLFE